MLIKEDTTAVAVGNTPMLDQDLPHAAVLEMVLTNLQRTAGRITL